MTVPHSVRVRCAPNGRSLARAGRRAAVASALLLLGPMLEACVWALDQRPGVVARQLLDGRLEDACTDHYAAVVADGILAAGFAFGGVVAVDVGYESSLGDEFAALMYAAALAGFAIAGLHVASAISTEAAECQRRKAAGIAPDPSP